MIDSHRFWEEVKKNMPTAEIAIARPEVELMGTQPIQTESAMDLEPAAEVLGKMCELSFQKHGGPDNSTMPLRL